MIRRTWRWMARVSFNLRTSRSCQVFVFLAICCTRLTAVHGIDIHTCWGRCCLQSCLHRCPALSVERSNSGKVKRRASNPAASAALLKRLFRPQQTSHTNPFARSSKGCSSTSPNDVLELWLESTSGIWYRAVFLVDEPLGELEDLPFEAVLEDDELL